MPSRLTHTKSRHGCVRCKQRRVKCDFQRPCTHCRRRNENCSLLSNDAYASYTAARVDRLNAHAQRFQLPPSPDDFSYLSLFLSHQPQPSPLAWTEDLFLMSHWTNSTSATIAHRDDHLHLWQAIIPEMAISSPFLMHGILAVAAMHLVHLRPQDKQKFETQSTYHQTLATSQFRVVLANITSENCGAVFAMCVLLTLISMIAIARRADADNFSFVDDMVHHFMLTRGIGDIMRSPRDHWQTVLGGPLRVLSVNSNQPDHTDRPLPADLKAQFDHLRHTDLPFLCKSDAEALKACTLALDALELIYKNVVFFDAEVQCARLSPGVALRWLRLVPMEFITLIKASHTAAFVLTAHFVVIFEKFGDQWYLQGWSEHALEMIKNVIEAEGMHALKWPSEQLQLEKRRRKSVMEEQQEERKAVEIV